MIFKQFKFYFFVIAMALLPSITIAGNSSLGEFAQELMEPVTIVSDFVGTGAIIIGICSLFGAFLRYMQYRKNPMTSPISTIIVLVIIGISLLGLPFIYKLTGAGVPYHLF